MLAWKVAPALATGNTVVLKPAETTPLYARCCSPRSASRPTCRRAWSTSSPAPATPAAPWSSTPTSTRWPSPAPPRSARQIARAVAGTRKSLTLELGGKAANIVFDDAPIDQAVEGIVQGIFFNQGHVCCAGSRLLVQENVHDEVIASAAAADRHAAGRRPAGQEHRHRRDQLRGAAGQDPRAHRRRRGRGRAALAAGLRAARARLLVPADGVHRRLPRPPHRPRGDLRPGAVACSPSGPRTRRWPRRTTPPTGCRPASGRRRARGSCRSPTSCAPAWSGPTRSTSSTRRRPSAATSSPATAARAAGTGSPPT